jgi:hypothetical protein
MQRRGSPTPGTLCLLKLPESCSRGVLPLEFKPAYSVGDLLTQHLEELEQEAESKGRILQALVGHFAKVYKAAPAIPPAA